MTTPPQTINFEDARIVARKIRNIAEHHTAGERHAYLRCAEAVESLFTPPLPTLAELIGQGNDLQQYQWMQADHSENGRIVITYPGSNYIYYMKTSGLSGGCSHSGADRITPRPDLPRLEWPGDGVVDAAIVNYEPAPTRPEDVPAGEAWIVQHEGLEWVGVRANDFRIPWSITSMDGLDYRDVDDSEITLISRLVPEVAGE